MSDERAPGFVDTNVLVYALDKSDSPKKQIALQLLNDLMENDRLRVSTQILQELFVTLTRKVRRPCSSEEASAVLEDLAAWPVMTVDYAAIGALPDWPARRIFLSGTHWLSLLQRPAAQRCYIPRI